MLKWPQAQTLEHCIYRTLKCVLRKSFRAYVEKKGTLNRLALGSPPMPQLEQFLLYRVLRKRDFEDREKERGSGREGDREGKKRRGETGRPRQKENKKPE